MSDTTSTDVEDKPRQAGTQHQGDNLMARYFLVALWFFATGPAEAFQTPGPGKTKRSSAPSEPKLPGAFTRIPDGVAAGAPFDVAAYFAAPPPELNAAPLYLDALFEFDPGMAICFPENAETARRKQIAARRIKSLRDQYQALATAPSSVDAIAVDRIVADLDVGMQKLEDAQAGPAAFFRAASIIPHWCRMPRPCARSPASSRCGTRRNLDRGNVDQPLHDLAVFLRLVRDVRTCAEPPSASSSLAP